jgi:hypothetical protein
MDTFLKSEGDILRQLRRVASPTGEQINQIWELYKKYINPNARPYTTGCSCDNDISTYYWSLMGWFSGNEGNFIND